MRTTTTTTTHPPPKVIGARSRANGPWDRHQNRYPRVAWAPRAAAGAAAALVVVETQSLSPSLAAIERHHTGETRRAPAHAAPTRGHLDTPRLAPRVAGPPARPHLTVTQLVDGEAPSMGSPAPGEPAPPSSGTPVPACVPPPSCRMPHRRGRARRPVHSRARPAASPQRRARTHVHDWEAPAFWRNSKQEGAPALPLWP